MKNFYSILKYPILTSLLFLFSSQVYGQDDTCADADGNITTVFCNDPAIQITGTPGDGTPEPELTAAGSCLGSVDAVWYAFQFDASITSFGFDALSTNAALFDGDCSNLNELECTGNNIFTNDPSATYYVAVVDGEAFDINLPTTPGNENCGSATMLSGTLSSETNECASAPSGGGCGGDHSVWYEVVMTGSNTTLEIIVTANGIMNPEVAIYDACGGTQIDDGANCNDVAIAHCLIPGNSYWVEVSSATGETGTFDIDEAQTQPGPPEDACTGAGSLGLLVCNGSFPENGITGSCPDPEATPGNCMENVNGTWFEFTTDTNVPEFTINSGDNFELFDGSCGSLNSLGDCSIDGMPQVATAGTTYYVLIDETGSFTVDAPPAPGNEMMSNPTTLSGTESGQNNFCASPPQGGCAGDNSVWYEVVVGADGTLLTISISPNGNTPIANAEIDIYDTGGTSLSTNGTCTDLVEAECLLMGTYLVEISTAVADAGEFDITETQATGPVGDICATAIDLDAAPLICSTNPFIGIGDPTSCPDSEATAGGCMDGVIGTWFTFTTDPSVPEFTITGSSTFELFEGGCGGLNSLGDCSIDGVPQTADPALTYFVLVDGNGDIDVQTTQPPLNDMCDDDEGDIDLGGTGPVSNCCIANGEVWFKLTPVLGDGVEIMFTNFDVGSSLQIEIYDGCGGNLLYSDTGDFSQGFANCGGTYHILVKSDAADCGNFELNYMDDFCTSVLEDACSASIPVTPLFLNTPVCFTGCAQYSCSGTCTTNGLWYAVELGVAGSVINITVTSPNPNFDPLISVYENDCSTADPGCEGTDDLDVGASGGVTYFVEIASNGVPDDFEVCFELLDIPAACAEWGGPTVERPENPTKNQDGPFCPGEKVDFCFPLAFTVDGAAPPAGNNCQWMHGVIPTFGEGWDLDACPASSQSVDPNLSDWYEDVDYYPHGITTNPVLSLIPNTNDPNGVGLQYTPGGGSLSSGDLLPGGWYGTTPTNGGANCDGGTHPNGSWGVNTGAGCNGVQNFNICFTLQVREYADEQDCLDADLSIHLFAMADGMTGCWDNTSCAQDEPASYLDGEIECDGLVELEADDGEICSGEPVDIFIETVDGSDTDIVVELINAGQTTGAMSHEPLVSGSSDGLLIDEIENCSGSIQIVEYEAFGRGENCDGPRIPIKVTVFPKIVIGYDEPVICPGEIYKFQNPDLSVTGGAPPYVYEWQDPVGNVIGNDPCLELPYEPSLGAGVHFVDLIITDANGCMEIEAIDFTITPGIDHSIDGNPDICLTGNATGAQYCAMFTPENNTAGYDFLWTPAAGLMLTGNTDDQCINVNEATTAPGSYTLTLEIEDDYECVHDTTIVVTLSNGPTLDLQLAGCVGNDVKLLGINTNHLNVPSFLHIIQPTGPAGTLLPGDTLGQGIPLLTDSICVTTSNFTNQLFLVGASAGGCMPMPIPLTIPPVQTPMFTAPSAAICEGASVTMSLDNPGTFTGMMWTDGTSVWPGASHTDMPTTNTTYTFMAMNAIGCDITQQFDVIVNPLPDTDISGSLTFCANESTDLTATNSIGTSPFTYMWNNGLTTQMINVTSGGLYSVVITDANGCSSAASVDVMVANSLTPNVTFNAFCADDPAGTTLDGGAFDTYQWYDSSGALANETNQTLTTSVPGDYYVEVTLGTCAGQSVPVTVAGVEPLPTPTDFGSIDVCNASGGAFNFEENLEALIPATVMGFWRNELDVPVNPATMVSFVGSTPGTITYTYVTTNAMTPCSNDTIPLTITINECGCPAPVAQLPDQCGDGSGPINLNSLTSSMGTWSTTSTDITITNNELILDGTTPTGTYDLVFTHTDPLPSNCTDPYGTSFTVYQPPTADLDQGAIPCNSTASGMPTFVDLNDLILSGDNSGTWQTTDQSITITNGVVDFVNLPVGAYNFTYVLQEAGSPCNANPLPLTVNVRDCSCPVLVINPIDAMCSSGDVINLNDPAITNNPDGLSGVWTMSPDVGALTLDQFDATGVPEDTYTFTFTLSNPVAGCPPSAEQMVVVSEPTTAVVPDEVDVCNGMIPGDPRPVALDLESLVTGDAGTWTAPIIFMGGVIADVNDVNFEGLSPDRYEFTYTVPANGACSETPYTMVVNVESCNCPTIESTIPELCNDQGDFDLNSLFDDPGSVGPGQWGFANGPTTPIITGTEISLLPMSGIYNFTFTLDDLPVGCPIFNIRITVDAQPDLTVLDRTACNAVSSEGDNCINLNSEAVGAAVIWTVDPSFPNDASDITNICFDGIAAGEVISFDYVLPNSNSPCAAVPGTMNVTVLDCNCPNIVINNPGDLCEGSLIALTTLETDPALIADGSWSVDNPDGVIAGSPPNQSFIPGAPGTYTLTYTPDDPGAPECDDNSQVTFEVFGLVSAGIADNYAICGGIDEVVTLGDRLTDQTAGGVWSAASTNPSGGTFDDVAGTFNSAGASEGTYEFMYTVDANPACGGSAEVVLSIDIEGGPTADAGANAMIACEETTTLGGTGSSTGNGITYEWSSTTGETLPSELNITVNQQGTYTLTVTDASGCTATSTVEVMSDSGLSANGEPTQPNCFGEPGVLVVSTTGASGMVQYSVDGGMTFQGSEIFENIAPGSYTLVVEDESGCRVTQTFVINQPDQLVVDAGEDRQVELGDDLYTLEAAIDDAHIGDIASVTWTNQETGVIECSGTYAQCGTIMVDPQIFNTYCVVVVDNDGCRDSTCVILREQLVKDVYIPNVFNPNETGNERFYIHTDRFVEKVDYMNIYDRWGELVFSAPPDALPNDPANGWNGRWNNDGNDVEQGVYVYVVKITYTDTGDGVDSEIFSGDITIYR